MAKKGSVVPPVHRRIRHGACPGPVEGGKQRGRMDSCLRRNDGGGGRSSRAIHRGGRRERRGRGGYGGEGTVAKKGGKCCITLHFVAFPLVIVKL